MTAAIAALRARNTPVPLPAHLPTPIDVSRSEASLGVTFPPAYRSYLLEASDVAVGSLEPCVVTSDTDDRDLVNTSRRAWDMGVPRGWLPICEDNGDYYCLDDERVRYWSHNGTVDEWWPDLATWIHRVWIGERG